MTPFTFTERKVSCDISSAYFEANPKGIEVEHPDGHLSLDWDQLEALRRYVQGTDDEPYHQRLLEGLGLPERDP